MKYDELNDKIFGGIFLIQCLIRIGIFFIVPDSLFNLAKKNNLTFAEKSLQWYRGEENIEEEFYDIKQYLRSSKDEANHTIIEKIDNLKILLKYNFFIDTQEYFYSTNIC